MGYKRRGAGTGPAFYLSCLTIPAFIVKASCLAEDPVAGKNGVPPLFKDFARERFGRGGREISRRNAGRVVPEAEKNRSMKNGRTLLSAITAMDSSEIASGK